MAPIKPDFDLVGMEVKFVAMSSELSSSKAFAGYEATLLSLMHCAAHP